MEWEDLVSASGSQKPVEHSVTTKEEYKERLTRAVMSYKGDKDGVADAQLSKSTLIQDIARMLCSIQSQYELSVTEYKSLPKSIRNAFVFAANSLYEDISGGKLLYQDVLDAYVILLTDEKYKKFTCSAVTIASDLAKATIKKEVKEDWKGDFLEQRKRIYGF